VRLQEIDGADEVLLIRAGDAAPGGER